MIRTNGFFCLFPEKENVQKCWKSVGVGHQPEPSLLLLLIIGSFRTPGCRKLLKICCTKRLHNNNSIRALKWFQRRRCGSWSLKSAAARRAVRWRVGARWETLGGTSWLPERNWTNIFSLKEPKSFSFMSELVRLKVGWVCCVLLVVSQLWSLRNAILDVFVSLLWHTRFE